MSRLEGQDGLLRRLAAIGEARPLLRELQAETRRQAKLLVPRKTGDLGRSIVPGSIGRDWAEVEARMSYAAAVELGSKPHRIPKTGNAKRPMPIGMSKRLSGRARTGSGRRYVGKGGMPSHAWHVNHPGTKPQPYLMPGAKAALDKAGITVIEQWNRAD